MIVTSDHGESFGEHEKIFCHGTSLYQTELRVPLLIIPPGGAAKAKVVNDTVSLRDLAATVVDVSGQRAGSPFPGHSLARFWDTRATEGLVKDSAHSEPDAMSASAAAELAIGECAAEPRCFGDAQKLVAKGRTHGGGMVLHPI